MGRLQELLDQIPRCMLADQHRLRRRAERLEAQAGDIPGEALTRLVDEMARSAATRRQRAARLPRPEFPPELPVSAEREAIARAIDANPVVIVCGETGSGKTTQLPKICLEMGRGAAGLIGHTQPRRVAARSVAARIAEELGTPLGEAVGYQVRFTAKVRPESFVKVMTDGILLAEIQTDRYLNAYDTLIIDEAHERSLNIDFLLGYLRRILPGRPELRVIITSATIDPERFSRHFGDAPIIEVSGRTYPVELRYRPLGAADEDERDRDLRAGILDAVDELVAEGPGDLLVFLAGEREIRETAEALHKHRLPATEVLPLYARLGAAEQDRVFKPHAGRRIVLATNVAETSLTVPGIRYVIDPGFARISRYSHRTKVQRLPVEPVSRASADQRKGRCGRVGPGICVRLYAEEDFEQRPAHTEPEIRRTNLAAVILQMRALRLGAVEDFPFIDPPDRRYVSDGYRLLRELGALDTQDRLTDIGRRLARLPVDPRLGRMVLAAAEEGCLREVLVIASALSIPDPRERPMDAREAADAAHAPFRDERSDFLGYLKLWDFYHEQARHLSQNKLRKLLKGRMVSWLRMREWREVHAQLAQLAGDLGLRPGDQPAEAPAIHRALLAGLLGHVGFKAEDREYAGPRGLRFQVSPGSAVQGAKWVVAAELVETRRLYAHTVGRVRPEWIEQVAGELVGREHFEPHWDRRRGEAFAYERVTLWGLTLVARRRVRLAPVDPALAREVFLRSGLVEGRLDTRAPFLARNQALIAELRGLEHKTRRPDVVVSDQAVFDFYAERIPADVHGGRSFERWWRDAARDDPERLTLTRETLLREAGAPAGAEAFPDRLEVDGHAFPLSYRFAPGEPGDGVTVSVPVAMLNQLRDSAFEWLVPGLLREKVIALMRTLPKQLRRHFVPLPDFADACLESLAGGGGGLREALTRELARMTGVEVPAGAWQPGRLDPHLRMNFRVLDEAGAVLAEERDLGALRERLGGQAGAAFAALPTPELERDQVRDWDFGALPESVSLERHGMRLRGYPVLVDRGGEVALRLLDSPGQAARTHRAGVRRLLLAKCAKDARYLARNLPGLQRMCLVYGTLPGRDGGPVQGNACDELKADLLALIAEAAFLEGRDAPRDPEAFAACLAAGAGRLVSVGDALSRLVGRILELTHEARQRRESAYAPSRAVSFADMDSQLAHLVYRGFLAETPLEWLRELPRYLEALLRRLQKIPHDASRDAARTREIAPLWQRYRARVAADPDGAADPALVHYRWMVEELRVSVFAQELGTRFPVSAPRLERRWAEVGRAAAAS